MNHWDDDFLLGGVAVAKKEKSVGEVKGGVTARFNVFFIIVVTIGNAYLAQPAMLLLHVGLVLYHSLQQLFGIIGRQAVDTDFAP